MRTLFLATMLGFGWVYALPALAESEAHRHGQAEVMQAAGPDAMEALQGQGKHGMKCKMGMGQGHAGGMRAQAGGEVEALKERLQQLEKRLDLMQTTLQLLAREGAMAPGHHGGQH